MTLPVSRKLSSWAHDALFRSIHQRHLVYNACWEDPRVDRALLQLDSQNKVVVITSAGCIQIIAESAPGGVQGYLRDKVRHVVTNLLTRENYFWRVYLHGRYTSFCCPNYLKPDNLRTLRSRVERVHVHDETLSVFLEKSPGRYTHFVHLDHQDWLAHHDSVAVEDEWRKILSKAERGARVLMRSAGLKLDFLPDFVRRALRFFPDWTARLHAFVRVGTYGSTHLAEVV